MQFRTQRVEEVKNVHKELPLLITQLSGTRLHRYISNTKVPFIFLDLNVTKLSKWIWIVCAGVCSRMTQASLNANVVGR